jgi:hypothetical protein
MFPDLLDEVEKANFGDVDSLMDCWVVDWDRVSNYTNSHLLAPARPGNGFVVVRADTWGVNC